MLVAEGWQVDGDGFGHRWAHGTAPAGHSREGFVRYSRFALGCVTQVAQLRAWSPPWAGPCSPSEWPDPEGALSWQPRALGTLLGCLADAGGPRHLDLRGLCWEPRVQMHLQVHVSQSTSGAGICMCQPVPPMQSRGVARRPCGADFPPMLLCQWGHGTCMRLLGKGPPGNEGSRTLENHRPSRSPLRAGDGKLELEAGMAVRGWRGWVAILQHLLL